MLRSRPTSILLAAALAGPVAWVAGAVPGAEAASPQSTAEPQGEIVTIHSHYSDHYVIETGNTATGRTEREVHWEDDEAAGAAAEDTAQQDNHGGAYPASGDPRCTNTNSYNWIPWGAQAVREKRIWRMPEALRINPAGAPALGSWRNLIQEGLRVWTETRNPCGIGDVIAIDMPWGPDTTAPACPGPSTLSNVVGFKDLGGWNNGSILLGTTCLKSSASAMTITEAHIALNSNPAVVWCDGACAGGWDLESVAAHEFGHLLGLGHTCGDAGLTPCDTAAESGAVMYPFISQNSTTNRTLSRGDIDGAHAAYPAVYGYEVVSAVVDNPAPGQKFAPGRPVTARVDLKNTGFTPWGVGASGAVKLGTASGGCSTLSGPSWLSCARASDLDAEIEGIPPHGNIPNDDTVVITGETARFTFTLHPGFDDEGVLTTEDFAISGPGVTGVVGTPAAVAVDVGTYAGSVVGQVDPTFLGQANVVKQGVAGSEVWVDVRNDGTAPWFVADGTVRLVTDSAGRCSSYDGSDWLDCTTVTAIDGADPVITPGESARFAFRFASPVDPTLLRAGISDNPPVPAAGWARERFDVEVTGRPARLGAQPFWSFRVV